MFPSSGWGNGPTQSVALILEGDKPKWYVPPPHTSAVFTAPVFFFPLANKAQWADPEERRGSRVRDRSEPVCGAGAVRINRKRVAEAAAEAA